MTDANFLTGSVLRGCVVYVLYIILYNVYSIVPISRTLKHARDFNYFIVELNYSRSEPATSQCMQQARLLNNCLVLNCNKISSSKAENLPTNPWATLFMFFPLNNFSIIQLLVDSRKFNMSSTGGR